VKAISSPETDRRPSRPFVDAVTGRFAGAGRFAGGHTGGLSRGLAGGLPGRLADQLAGFGRRAVRLNWPYRPGWLDAAWVVSFGLGLIAIIAFPDWETVPLHLIWISATLLYGFRTWPTRPTLLVLGVVLTSTGTVMGLDVVRGREPLAELTEVPMMAAMFGAMVWHARRKIAAEREARLVGEENARLLATQRRFLQDASHQLRTPITIALGHAELLASDLSGRQQGDDIGVILGELTRLRRIAERLLVIAAAEDPEFLHPEPVALDSFTMDVLRRWRPTAERRWQLGRLDKVTIQADRERLGLAVDALLENAVRHTASGDVIKLSVTAGPGGAGAGPSGAGPSGAGLSGTGFVGPGLAGAGLAGAGPSGAGLSGSGFVGPGLAGAGFVGPGLSGAGPAGSGPAGVPGVADGADGEVRMTVTDGGSGIAAALLPHVFDRFSIGNSGHPRGTGLGLALVRAVARAHGGEVLVRSWPGRGSDFELLLPSACPFRSADGDGMREVR
jgi:signal transduction histidine kinase